MYAIYGVPFTINIPQMLAYIPYMDPMGYQIFIEILDLASFSTEMGWFHSEHRGRGTVVMFGGGKAMAVGTSSFFFTATRDVSKGAFRSCEGDIIPLCIVLYCHCHCIVFCCILLYFVVFCCILLYGVVWYGMVWYGEVCIYIYIVRV